MELYRSIDAKRTSVDNDFQPLYEEKDKDAFDVWQMKMPEPEPVIEIDEKEEFAKECARLREEVKKAAYEEGMQQAAAELQQKRQELASWLTLIQNPVELLDDALSQEIVQTIAWIFEACIGIELSIHPKKLLTLLEEIKREFSTLQGDRELVMNPLDVEWLLNELSEQQVAGLTALLVADPSLSRGDFYLKNEYGELDGRLKTRLQKLFKNYLLEDGAESTNNKDSQ